MQLFLTAHKESHVFCKSIALSGRFLGDPSVSRDGWLGITNVLRRPPTYEMLRKGLSPNFPNLALALCSLKA